MLTSLALRSIMTAQGSKHFLTKTSHEKNICSPRSIFDHLTYRANRVRGRLGTISGSERIRSLRHNRTAHGIWSKQERSLENRTATRPLISSTYPRSNLCYCSQQ